MKRTIFHPLAIFAAFLAAACVTAPGLKTANTSTPAVPAWTPALNVAPTEAACRAAPKENRTQCYQILLASVLKSRGIDSAMAELTRLAATESVVRDNSHMFAHSLGLAAFTTPEELAAVFSRCSPGFQSGCYHGVIQGYFLYQQRKDHETDIGAAEINSLCRDFRNGENRWLLFQCAHGLGHGLELIYAHDLPRSLGGCDLVPDAWERSACYGGAFMENIVSVTNPHQTAEGIAGGMEMEGMEGDMSGMDMSGMSHSDTSEKFKKYDPADPHYPCSALPERYGSQCYLIQTSLVLFENHGDFAAAAKVCESAPAAFRPDCFVSLGRDANSYAGSNIAAAARSCLAAAETFRPWCHTGVAKNLVDITANPADGFRYCASLRERASKVTCYSAVGEEIAVLAPDSEKRKAMCAAVSSPFDSACLYGAGVITERPAGLVR